MTVLTLADVEATYSATFLDHLDRGAHIPTIDRIAAQGDVLIRRLGNAGPVAQGEKVPAEGTPVVRGENGGNTHLLVGDAYYDSRSVSARSLVLGVITVPQGGTALLTHPEHGGFVLEPGLYEARRQREQADELRVVAD